MRSIRQIIHKLLASICHMGIFRLFLGYFVGMWSLPHEQVHKHTLTPSLTPRPPPLPPPATLLLLDTHKDTQVHRLAEIVTVIKRLPSCVNLTAGKRHSALQRGTTVQTVRVGSPLDGRGRKASSIVDFFFPYYQSHMDVG